VCCRAAPLSRADTPLARARLVAGPQPAPIYILDEVDAALDLSHTQNIGRMIRTHFPYSQFIVVSLKEGMFNNANVIFRTKVRLLLLRVCLCLCSVQGRAP
jgi:ABC-type transport system involved in cytochrome c biogenesis ATPase subunit